MTTTDDKFLELLKGGEVKGVTLLDALRLVDQIFEIRLGDSLQVLRDRGAADHEIESLRVEMAAEYAAGRDLLRERVAKCFPPNQAG